VATGEPGQVSRIVGVGMNYLLKPAGIKHGYHFDVPLGLLSIAGTLKAAGVPCKVVDLKIEPMPEIKPGDVVGVTCFTQARHDAFDVCRQAKEAGAYVVLGGPHATLMWQQIRKEYPFIDCVCEGDGEELFLSLCCAGDCVIDNFRELDDYPLPDWEQCRFEKYPKRYPKQPLLSEWNGVSLATSTRVVIIFGRGCIGHCTFCSARTLFGNYRHRSPEHMMSEIRLLVSMGQRHFSIADDCFSANMKAAKELCRAIIESGIKIAWICTTRVDCVDEELLALMREAGCYWVGYGVESADPEVMQRLGKVRYTIDQAIWAVQETRKTGMLAGAFMIDSPWDTAETKRLNEAFIATAKPDIHWTTGSLWIFPGTQLYEDMKARGVIDDSFWLGPEPQAVWK
jgi:anaerobic magnesium-protoporphyrin IX monomethyl ester cyclase